MERSHHAFQFDAFVVAGIFSARDDHAALALGDGSVHLLPSVSEPKLRTVAVHQGTILSLSQDISPDAFLSGGEDGRFIRITAAGTVQELACFGGRWVDHVAASPTLGLRACSVGKWVYLYEEKVRSWAWSYDGHCLITTGTNRAVCWPFRDKDGPMGKTLLEVGEGGRQLATAVASHPLYPYVVIGFQDRLTLMTALEADSPCLPLRSSGHSAVTVLVFALDGRRLLLGDEAGKVRWFNLPEI
jgi:hypothetical protein